MKPSFSFSPAFSRHFFLLLMLHRISSVCLMCVTSSVWMSPCDVAEWTEAAKMSGKKLFAPTKWLNQFRGNGNITGCKFQRRDLPHKSTWYLNSAPAFHAHRFNLQPEGVKIQFGIWEHREYCTIQFRYFDNGLLIENMCLKLCMWLMLRVWNLKIDLTQSFAS